jgi:hypothetical protein
MVKMVVLVVVLGALVGTAGESDAAAVLCKRKSKLILRETACKARETAVQLDGASVELSTLPKVGAATQADSATQAVSADDADTLDGKDSGELQGRIRWALVSLDGSQILAQSGGISILAEALTGVVVLDFGEDLRGRGVLATVRGGLTSKGWAQAAICGGGNDGGPQVSFCNIGGSVTDMPNELAISTIDPDGNAADRSFYVAVLP